MTASPNIKTPAMDVPLLATPTARDKGEALKKLFTRVCLSEVCSMPPLWALAPWNNEIVYFHACIELDHDTPTRASSGENYNVRFSTETAILKIISCGLHAP